MAAVATTNTAAAATAATTRLHLIVAENRRHIRSLLLKQALRALASERVLIASPRVFGTLALDDLVAVLVKCAQPLQHGARVCVQLVGARCRESDLALGKQLGARLDTRRQAAELLELQCMLGGVAVVGRRTRCKGCVEEAARVYEFDRNGRRQCSEN